MTVFMGKFSEYHAFFIKLKSQYRQQKKIMKSKMARTPYPYLRHPPPPPPPPDAKQIGHRGSV